MAQKTAADRLEASINKILEKYADDIKSNLNAITKEFAKKGASAIRQDARAKFGGTGEYASGWTTRYEEGRHSAQGVIYNKKVPGLPHLLEKPHAKRGGGRTTGNPHIAPVEEQISREYEKAVEKSI